MIDKGFDLFDKTVGVVTANIQGVRDDIAIITQKLNTSNSIIERRYYCKCIK